MSADGLPVPTDLAADIAARTDSYFSRTRRVVARFGDKRVTYAVFLRRPVISAPRSSFNFSALTLVASTFITLTPRYGLLRTAAPAECAGAGA